MSTDNFKSKDFGLKVQKKLLGKISSKNTAKMFIDERSANLLDNVYRLFKLYSGNKKTAEKMLKYIIKTVVKIGLLYRGDHFSEEEMHKATKLKSCFQKAAMTTVSFYELDYSYDRNYLILTLTELKTLTKQLVEHHLTPKSLNRIDLLYQFCSNPEFLDSIFKKDFQYRDVLSKIVYDFNLILEEEGITA